jgi:hypothetical protein
MALIVAGCHAFKGTHATSNLSLSCVEREAAVVRAREKEKEREQAREGRQIINILGLVSHP